MLHQSLRSRDLRIDPSLLPAPALRKLNALQDASDVAESAVKVAHDRYGEAWQKLKDVQENIRRVRDRGGDLLPQAAASLLPKREAAQAEYERYAARQAECAARAAAATSIVVKVERWLNNLNPWCVLAVHPGVTPKLGKGQNPQQAIKQLREQMEAVGEELRQVAAAPLTSGCLKELAHQQIDELAARGRPELAAFVERGGQIPWPMIEVSGTARVDGAPGRASVKTHDPLALFAWLHREQMIAALDAEIDAVADDDAALSQEDRAARKASLEATLLELERIEEAIISELEEAGLVAIERRPDADPRAVLGLADEPIGYENDEENEDEDLAVHDQEGGQDGEAATNSRG